MISNNMNNTLKWLLFCLLYISLSAFSKPDLIVAKDGSGDFRSIQAAINSLPSESNKQRIIFIKKGTYDEKIFIEKNFISLVGEDKFQTSVITSEARDIYRCAHTDDWGVATLNLKGNDINLENITFVNSYGILNHEDVMVPCKLDSVNTEKKIRKDGHQMVLRSFATTRLFAKNCIFKSLGGDSVSPWNTEDGMYYFKDCVMEGAVDFYCPRGWALADHCEFICHSKEAAIWHDGSKYATSKSVFLNCSFKGDEGYKLGRYHRDAQFYLFDCSFDKNMADAEIFQKAANPPNNIQWGKRVYFYNCHKQGGNYKWHADNIPNEILNKELTASWVYDYKWTPSNDKIFVGTSLNSIQKTSASIPTVDTVAENMLLYQRSNGGWPKQFQKEKVDYHRMLSAAELKELKDGFESSIDATIDNNATTKEIRYLCKAYKKSKDSRFLAAAEHGVEYLLNAQYPNGGWPQYFPDFSSYRSEITFNDNAMINALNVLVDVLEGTNELEVINEKYLNRCSQAVQRGLSCIMKLQVRQNGKPTAWCAQYDAKTLQPAKARAYELISLSGQETVGIVRFLMHFENPGEDMQQAINGAIDWFEKVKIVGFKFKEVESPNTPNGKDKMLVADSGNVTWARFYDIENNEPFFCGRDGVRKKNLSEVEHERRMGYSWYNETPVKLIRDEYPVWKSKWVKNKN